MMNQQRRFPIGIQSFKDIINGKYAYVDKTELVYRLANYGKFFFLSRPRRFGKSLLVSTLEAYFTGKKELFAGLAMEQLETDWEQYPVLRLDLNVGDYSGLGTEALIDKLDTFLQENEQLCGYESHKRDLGVRFEQLVKRLAAKVGKSVVVLIDEYDKPLTETINNDKLNAQMRDILKNFYATLKSQDDNIRFALLTGVSRFSHLTIFSGLNNLIDISMVDEFAEICGVTEQELHDNFDDDVQRLADKNGLTKQEAYDKLRDNYDGYHFVPDGEGLYNPFSLMNVLNFRNFKDYWSFTGTPTFLVKLLQQADYDLTKLYDDTYATDRILQNIDVHNDAIAVMYQSGYLTIKGYNNGKYKLGFPNGEVRRAFMEFVVPFYMNVGSEQITYSTKLEDAVQSGDVDKMMNLFKEMLGKTPCETNEEAPLEKHYRNTIFVMVNMCGEHVEVEKATARGRIDVAIESKDYVYVMELKRGTTDEAAEQIEDRHYLDAYAADERKVIALAVALNDNTHNIGNWRVVNG